MHLGNWFVWFSVCCRYHSCQRACSGVSGRDREKRQILAPPSAFSPYGWKNCVTRESCMPFLWGDKTIKKRSIYVTRCAFHLRFGGNKAPFREYIFWFINARDLELLPFEFFFYIFHFLLPHSIFYEQISKNACNRMKGPTVESAWLLQVRLGLWF